MDDYGYYSILAIVLLVYIRDKTTEKFIEKKINIVNQKLNTLIDANGIEYPNAEHISYKAKQAIKGGNRVKATELILQETECSHDQALMLIEKLEKLNFPYE